MLHHFCSNCSFHLHFCFSKDSQCDLFCACVQVKTNLADLQFLFMDICLMTSLAIVMGRGGPSEELHNRRPPASLLAVPVMGSIFIHTCMIILGQLGALFITTSRDWSVKKEEIYTKITSKPPTRQTIY